MILRWFNFLLILYYVQSAEDFYSLLGVSKTATDREIRQAFKRKALKLHPDKNPDDPGAQAKFLELKRAYEVLKDEELRKKYDLNGEEGLKDDMFSGRQYKSWKYYNDNFGIYDDDPEIITLNKADFEQSVLGADDVWFINFYHPMCSHCHTLAPTWRKLSIELNNVVRVGAVNCEDEFELCRSQGVGSYPTLISYPQKAKYLRGQMSLDNLLDFITKKLKTNLFVPLETENLTSFGPLNQCDQDSWLVVPISLYEALDEAPFMWKTKIGALFESFVCLGEVDCLKNPKLCTDLKLGDSLKYFRTTADITEGIGTILSHSSPQDLFKEILGISPEIPRILIKDFEEYRLALQNADSLSAPLLVVFTGADDENQLEFRKLPSYLPTFQLGRVTCHGDAMTLCDALYVTKTPTFALFKSGGGYEFYQGRAIARDIAVFARESAMSTRFQVLTPEIFSSIVTPGLDTWFVDFYAPWCPPCRRLLPEFRKASRVIDLPVRFGSIDCTVHAQLCQGQGVRQYPTTVLFMPGKSMPSFFTGYHSASQLIDFVKDTVDPKVIEIEDLSYYQRKVLKKPTGETWIVDFYANWCGPCRDMNPEFRKFSRIVSEIPNIHVAQVDCAVHSGVCRSEGITGYPTVRIFPFGSYGNRRGVDYRGWSRDSESFRLWMSEFLPSNVSPLDEAAFEDVLRSPKPHLVDFYAPWCGPCRRFAPVFNEVATKLEGKIEAVKIDCQAFNWVCKGARVRAYPSVVFYPGARPSGARQDPMGYQIASFGQEAIVEEVLLLLRKTGWPEVSSETKDEL